MKVSVPQISPSVSIDVRRAIEALVESINKTLGATDIAAAGATLALTGDVTGQGTSPILVTIAVRAVTLNKLADLPAGFLMGRVSAGNGPVELIDITNLPIGTDLQTVLDGLAPLDSPHFTGTITGITKSMVGLGNADDTADSAKPVSTAQAAAIAAVDNVAVGLGNVTNDAQVKASQVGGYAAGAPSATGYIPFTIGGTTYKLIVST